MENIYLTGMPGCGKSALGEKVAKQLGLEFVDVDKVVVDMANEEDVVKIFQNKGVNEFRKMEKQAIKDLSTKQNLLISTGGGAILDSENCDVMINTGKVIFVDVSIETLTKRIDTSSRPLVKDIGPALQNLYFNRYDKYKNNCTHIFNNDGDIETSAIELAKIINE